MGSEESSTVLGSCFHQNFRTIFGAECGSALGSMCASGTLPGMLEGISRRLGLPLFSAASRGLPSWRWEAPRLRRLLLASAVSWSDAIQGTLGGTLGLHD